jgi:dihydrofolate synthase/folylpolyglutamate synthase
VLGQNLGSMGFFRYTYAVFGAMRDKDIEGVVKHLAGEIDHWCLTDLPLGRAASAQDLEKVLRASGVEEGPDSSIARFASPAEAFQDALSRATEDDRIVVFGSFYTVAGVMAYRKSRQH